MDRDRSFKYSTTFYRRRKKLKLKKLRNLMPFYTKPFNSTSSTLDPSLGLSLGQPAINFNAEIDHTEENRNEDFINSDLEVDDLDAFTDCSHLGSNNEQNHIELTKCKDLEDSLGIKVRKFLPEWALSNKITHSALNDLLKGLTSCGIPGLPKDSRTLLKTPQVVVVEKMGSGQFWYNGLENGLISIVADHTYLTNQQCIKLNFHVDGISINNSSRHQFWPILMNVSNSPIIRPQVIAIFYGDSKPPSAYEFLNKMTQELNDLLQKGLCVNGYRLLVGINAFICDTPARSFIKCTVPFNAYHSCNKCTITGMYYRRERHMSFPQMDFPLRTDNDFRNRTDSDHHQKNIDGEYIVNPLELLPIDMVKDIPIADSLHLIDLGIMKRCLNGWVNGSKNFKVKFFSHQINVISTWLTESNMRMPSELHRSVRSLNCLSFWKASEYRTFLFYLGPVILKDHLTLELYKHFILFFCAVTLCSCSYYTSKLSLAQELFIDYIEGFISNYGVDAISSNVHNLCHIVEDVKRFGPLPSISSYPFENHLGFIKNFLRSGNRPLSQIAKRMSEISHYSNATLNEHCSLLQYEISDQAQKPPEANQAFKKVKLKNGVCFSTNVKDKWLLSKNNDIVQIISIYALEDRIVAFGPKIKKPVDFFDYPFKSSCINIYISQEIFSERVSVEEFNIKCKLVSIKYNDKLVFLPLIHTLDLFNT